jgi:hypothetical protein
LPDHPQYIRQGGAKAKVEEKSQLSVGLDVLMGKAYLSDLKKPTEEELAEEERVKQQELERSNSLSHYLLSSTQRGIGRRRSFRRTRRKSRVPTPSPFHLKHDHLHLLLLFSQRPRLIHQTALLLLHHLPLLSAPRLLLLHLPLLSPQVP